MNLKLEFIIPEKDIVTIEHQHSVEGIERITVDDVKYIRFDGLALSLRDYVHNNPLYKQEEMKEFQRTCGCGKGYFLEENYFFQLIKGY